MKQNSDFQVNTDNSAKTGYIWMGHASVVIFSGKNRIYIDPYDIDSGERGSVIITHPHFDHCSKEDINRIYDPCGVFLSPCRIEGCVSTRILKPGDQFEIADISVEATAAYNIKKSFHPVKNGWPVLCNINS